MIKGLKNQSDVFSRIATTASDNDLYHQNQVVKAEILWASHMADNPIAEGFIAVCDIFLKFHKLSAKFVCNFIKLEIFHHFI